MADPLSQLRQFHINGREIKEHGNYIIFGDHGWPKNVNTNYQIFSTDEDKNKKEYYTLECLLYFLKNIDVAHHHYVRQAGSYNIPVVHRPDRKNLLAYLKGETQTSSNIDKNAPIPQLRLSVAEIYKKDQPSATDPQPSTSSQLTNQQSQHDINSGDVSASMAKKRPHDPEMEKKIRDNLAARLYEPSTKKMAPIIPTESIEKVTEGAEGSAAINKFGAEKLAALRAKALANKSKRINEIHSELGKPGSGVTEAGSREAELLIAMDSDQSRLIKSKEKVWRTRSSVLQAQSKDFVKTVLPFVELMNRIENPNKRPPSQAPGSVAPNDVQSNPYQPQQQQQQLQQLQQQQPLQQQQTVQRNAYSRYDQERFAKLDIGVEIDTKKSFVSGSNGLAASPAPSPAAPQVVNRHMASPAASHLPGAVPTPNKINNNFHQHDNRHRSMGAPVSLPPGRHPRRSVVPIIIIPATPSSLINMYNAGAILQDLTYSEGNTNRTRESELLIHRRKPDGSSVPYKVLDNPVKLDAEDWKRVVAVFVQGPAWQFKGWPWGGSPVEIFSQIKGFHLKWDESKLDDNVAKWNVHILELSRSKRHLDKANLLKFWSSLDNFMVKYKNFLRF